MFLIDVTTALIRAKVPFAIVGGYAVSLHGALRATFDLDIVIEHRLEKFIDLEIALKSIDLVSRIPVSANEVFQFRKEYIEKRNLIAWSFNHSTDPLKVVDVILTFDLTGKAVIMKNIGGTKVPVLAKELIIKMKENSARAQDIEDVRALKRI